MDFIQIKKNSNNKEIDLENYLTNISAVNDENYIIAKIHAQNSNPFKEIIQNIKPINDEIILKKESSNTNKKIPDYQESQLEIFQNLSIPFYSEKQNQTYLNQTGFNLRLENRINFYESYKVNIPNDSRLKYYR